jgi:hypothetical protein
VANHDFWCQICGQVLVDINVPIAVGATAGAPLHCGRKMNWIPAVARMDASSGPGFQEFEAHDGQNNKVVVDSLKKLRDIERTSEQQYRNGEGQPLVWRRWSQDSSNRDVHSLDPARFSGGERPDPAYTKKFGLRRFGATEPDHSYGPGVDDSNTSALDHLKE